MNFIFGVTFLSYTQTLKYKTAVWRKTKMWNASFRHKTKVIQRLRRLLETPAEHQ